MKGAAEMLTRCWLWMLRELIKDFNLQVKIRSVPSEMNRSDMTTQDAVKCV